MLARDPIAGDSPTSCAVDFVASLPGTRLSVSDGSSLALAAPIARFRITAGELQPRADLDQVAFHWGWRFYVVRDARILPLAVDVRPGRHAGSWRAGLVTGKHLLQQLRLVDRLSTTELAGTVRILDAPGLNWSGLWIVGGDMLLVSLKGGRPISEQRLLSRLRQTASRQRLAAETRTTARERPELAIE